MNGAPELARFWSWPRTTSPAVPENVKQAASAAAAMSPVRGLLPEVIGWQPTAPSSRCAKMWNDPVVLEEICTIQVPVLSAVHSMSPGVAHLLVPPASNTSVKGEILPDTARTLKRT